MKSWIMQVIEDTLDELDSGITYSVSMSDWGFRLDVKSEEFEDSPCQAYITFNGDFCYIAGFDFWNGRVIGCRIAEIYALRAYLHDIFVEFDEAVKKASAYGNGEPGTGS